MAGTFIRRLLQTSTLLLLPASTTLAATVTYDFDISWVTANPDGAFDRPTIGINGQWPIPAIRAKVGDRVVINAKNSLGNETTSLHFHGLFMNGTTHMDGPVAVSQCPIQPGHTFVYDFLVDQPGTYWYHSHSKGQYPDGLRGAFIVEDPEIPFKFDEEVVLTLSDWYHRQMVKLIPEFMSKTNPTGAEPVPDAALMNDTQDLKIPVQPGKTYMFRLVNMGAFASQYVWFEGHELEIIEIDGIYTEPKKASMVYLSAGQRASVLVKTKKDVTENFAIIGSMDTTLFDVLEDDLQYNVTGWLVYSPSSPLPTPTLIDEFSPIDDTTLVPYDRMPLLPAPKEDRIIHLTVKMDNLNDGANYAFFNNITYTPPRVPTLYTVLSAPASLVNDPRIYGSHTNAFVLEKDEIVQIVLDNEDDGRHPFHLHGHNFQILHRGDDDSGSFSDSNLTESDFPRVPMRRDTVVVWPNGNVVLRFKADNAGIWLFHCHIEWHVDSGLIATMVEAPLELQAQLLPGSANPMANPLATRSKQAISAIPQNHWDTCAAGLIPTRGNAAGNEVDFLDLKGENAPPGPLPEGFTAKGYVALLISCLSGITGLLAITWYGLAPIEGSGRRDDEAVAGGGVVGGVARTSEDSVGVDEAEEGEEGRESVNEERPLLSRSAHSNEPAGPARRGRGGNGRA